MNLPLPEAPPMSRGTKVWLRIISVGLIVSLGLIVVGWKQGQDEQNARIAGQCAVIRKTRAVLQGVLETATEERSTHNVTDPAQLERIEELNAQLRLARAKYAPQIAVLVCDDSG